MRRGFLLLEFILSFALGSCILLLGARFSILLVERSRFFVSMCTHFMSLLHASWFLDSYLSRAPCDSGFWKLLNRDCVIWHDPGLPSGREVDYCLCVEQGDLVLIEGTFDVQWKKREKVVVLKNAGGLEFDFYRDQNFIYGISYRLSLLNETVQSTVRMVKPSIASSWHD